MAVSERAVLRRINRRLAHKGEALRVWRVAGYEHGTPFQPGDYYHIDTFRNSLVEFKVDLEAMARELGVMSEQEQIACST